MSLQVTHTCYLLIFYVSKLLLMMVCLTLLLIIILTGASGATPLYCSDVQSPASDSHNTADLSQVTTLQYCIIDNCTIMRTDTGQQLDIIYTTESLLIVTPIDDHTSMVVIKIADDNFPCLDYHNHTTSDSRIGELIGSLTLTSLIIMVSSYILLVHLLFKELRTLFGKLLIFYSLSIVSMSADIFALLLMHYWIIVKSEIICYTAVMTFMITYTSVELFATNLLTHLAYIMYRCYNLKAEISKRRSQILFRCYLAYALITLILFFFVTITYDRKTENSRYTLLPNGHCNFIDMYSYKTLILNDTFVFINKLIQIIMLLAYLVYFYKFNVNIGAGNVNVLQYNQELLKIAIAMGATIGLSFFVYAILIFDSEYSHIIGISGTVLLFVQQVLIMSIFLCTKKISSLCKAYFSRD